MASAYSAISSYSRVEILHVLLEHPGSTIAELVDATDLHANTVREHLQRLIDTGYVVVEPERRETRGRPRMLYRAVAGADATSSPIARRKVREAAQRGDLMRKVMPWTETTLPPAAQHQLDALLEDLQEAGFEPVVDVGELTVDLTPCAHATAQADHREMLCAVHVGLMQGVLAEAGGPLTVEGLRPTCNPSECHVQLMLNPQRPSEVQDADAPGDHAPAGSRRAATPARPAARSARG